MADGGNPLRIEPARGWFVEKRQGEDPAVEGDLLGEKGTTEDPDVSGNPRGWFVEKR